MQGLYDAAGRRKSRRGTIGVALVIGLMAAAVPAAAQNAGTNEPQQGPTAEDMAVFEDLLNQGPAPPSDSDVAASESAYDDLSDGAAIDAVEAAFPDTLNAELIPELELEPNQEAGEFFAPNIVQVEIPGAPSDAVVESTLPLRAPESGSPELLDAELERDGDHFEADNPLVTAEIAAEPVEGFAGPGGVTVLPEIASAAEAVTVEDKRLVPNAGTDLDTLIAPTATGAQVFYFVRSPEAAERFSIDHQLPAGATLQVTESGGALIENAGAALTEIGAPVATDAAGQPVDVHYAVEGSRLDVVVPHRERGYEYPLQVDPAYGWYNWEGTHGEPQNPSTNMWSNAIKSPTTSAYVMPAYSNPTRLANRAPAGSYNYPQNSYGEWIVTSWANTFAERVDFYNFDQVDPLGRACTIEGIAYAGAWLNGTVHNAQTGGLTSNQPGVTVCGTLTNQTRSFWVGTQPTPDQFGSGDPEAPVGSVGAFMLFTWAPGTRNVEANNLLRAANVWRFDWTNPTIATIQGSPPPTGWVDDTDGTNISKRATFNVADNGLGFHQLRVTNAAGTVVSNSGPACNSSHFAPCPATYTASTHQLPEGVSDLTARAWDAGERFSNGIPWTAKIDRSAPQITNVSGSLVNEAEGLLTNLDYEVTITATDGSTASDGAKRSGVVKLELLADGQVVHGIDEETGEQVTMEKTQTCDPGAGSCPMTHTFNIPGLSIPANTNSLAVRATDAIGHTTTSQITPPGGQKPLAVRTDTDEPDVSPTTANDAPNGQILVKVDVRDGFEWNDPQHRPGGSGVTEVNVFLNGEKRDTITQGCLQGGCAAVKDVYVDAPGGLQDNEVVVIAYDRGGQASIKRMGKRKDAVQRYGFNGFLTPAAADDPNPQFDDTDVFLDRVTQGGGDTVRFPITWCGIVEGQAPGVVPPLSSWPANVRLVFEEVKERNEDADPNNNLEVVPNLSTAPRVVNGVNTCTGVNNGTPPTPGQIDEWRNFVGEVLDAVGPAHDDPDTPAVDSVGDSDYGLAGVEIWNEPNLPNFWGSTSTSAKEWTGEDPAGFANLVNTAYPELQATGLDGQVKLVPGGVSPDGATPTPKEYARVAYSAMNQDAVDAISIHLYANHKPRDRGAVDRILGSYNKLIEGLDEADNTGANPFLDAPRWITEIGFPSDNIVPANAAANSSEASQRRRLLDSFWRFSFKNEVTMLLVHTHHDWTDASGSEANNFGLWRAVPEGTVQCADGIDNDGDGNVDFAGLNPNDGFPDESMQECKGTFDTWEGAGFPPAGQYHPKTVFCRLGDLAALEGNPFTEPEC